MARIFYSYFAILLFLVFSCRSSSNNPNTSEKKTFLLQQQLIKNKITEDIPYSIEVDYSKDSILINNIFNDEKIISYKLHSRNKEYYINNSFSNGKSYLFLKNQGPDSCYSLTLTKDNKLNDEYYSKSNEIDLCFSNLKQGNFSTTIRMNPYGSISHNEIFFYNKHYKFYKIALRLNNQIYWYLP
ncbi:hypothetical protein ETU09_01565 [Apibacter muscae]|uniref:Lipoprotein n=1 Tax=Apibacter muscae TaxID=2509004 RepID=A0A563DI44_9FLAO|nr:hypothetical protein [Apibacter muscae]TWP29691.1 hypothetical protein ETU09_01565 [Apibacter muscae]